MKKLFQSILILFLTIGSFAQTKVYTKGGVFYMVDTQTTRQYEGITSDVLVVRSTTSSEDFYFRNVNGWLDAQFLNIADIQNELGVFYTLDQFIEFYENQTGVNKGSNGIIVDLALNDLGRDSWGRQKTYEDHSILHGMFTFNVPVTIWKELFNGVERPFVNATSVNGKLNLTSGPTLNDQTKLATFRNPRYQPNRGHLYSTAVFLPNPEKQGSRKFGFFTEESGSFFELRRDSLFAVIRTTIDAVVVNDERYIDTDVLGLDLEKGNIYDIQMQWRGVGNYKFYINLKEVKSINYLGNRTELTMFNPANPICFESKNLNEEVLIEAGCVDVTSEGGDESGKSYGSVSIDTDNGEVTIAGLNAPILALRSKLTIDGKLNTRDVLALLATAYSDAKTIVRVWATRDFTAITENDQTWRDFGDGHLEYIYYDVPAVTTEMSFNISKAQLIFGSRIDANQAYSTSALFEGRTDIFLSPGDMFIFTIHTKTGASTNAGLTFEFAEEI